MIHGGDITHTWKYQGEACEPPNYSALCDTKQPNGVKRYELDRIWGRLNAANIPFISAAGNHDLLQNVKYTNEFIEETYKRAKNAAKKNGDTFDYSVVAGTGSFADNKARCASPQACQPPAIKAEFKGVQIANFQYKAAPSHVDAMSNVLDKHKTTLVVSHVPLKDDLLNIHMKADGYNYNPYQGCYSTSGQHIGVYSGQTLLKTCADIASTDSKPYFGMEWPQGSNTPGTASCAAAMTKLPSVSVRVADAECDYNGLRLGGPYRIAVYATPTQAGAKLTQFMSGFGGKDKAALFSGHVHGYAKSDHTGFWEHTAPYPHPTICKNPAGATVQCTDLTKYPVHGGMLAVLVSPTRGVLQVKPLHFGDHTNKRAEAGSVVAEVVKLGQDAGAVIGLTTDTDIGSLMNNPQTPPKCVKICVFGGCVCV